MARGLGKRLPRTALKPTGLPLYIKPFAPARMPPAFEYRLRDETRVLVRWVTADDGPLFREGFKALSEQSRLRRFFTAASELTDQQIRYFTDIDHVNHMAWGARDLDRDGQPGVGVARYIRLPDSPDEAEVAITVVDAYQDTGAGTLLYAVLNYSAAEHGVRQFVFDILEENSDFIRRLNAYGGRQVSSGCGVVQIRVPVCAHAGEVPDDTPSGRALGSVMRRLTQTRPVQSAQVEMLNN